MCMFPITSITVSRSLILREIFSPSGAVTVQRMGNFVIPMGLPPTAAEMFLWSSISTACSSSMRQGTSSKSGVRPARETDSSDTPAVLQSLMAVCVRAAVSLWRMPTTTGYRSSQARGARISVPQLARPGFAICAGSAVTKSAVGVFVKEKACWATSFTRLPFISANLH